MNEQKTITISVDKYRKAVAELTRFDMLKEELIAVRGTYIDDEVQERLLRMAGIEEEIVEPGKEAEVAMMINKEETHD